ncbi:hypothetical protein HaLaN_23944, partial [Haematococcus lacustris]
WLQAGRTRRCSTCPAGGFQPAGLVALRVTHGSHSRLGTRTFL